MNPIEQLKSVLFDHEGKCCIDGSDEDRAIIDRALQALTEPAVEPAMWAWQRDDGSWYDASATNHSRGMRPLYTSPPPPADVPMLTQDDIVQIILSSKHLPLGEVIRLTEKVVRQKAGLK